MVSIEQIKNRKVIQWLVAYGAGAWAVLQLAQFLASVYNWPTTILRVLPVLFAVGAVAVLIVAWFHGEKGEQRVRPLELAMLAALPIIAGAAVSIVRGRTAHDDVVKAAAPAAEQGSVAVLPFADESPAKDHMYFSDGLTEELRNVLADIPQLRVAARVSSFSFRDSKASLDSIAHALHVQYILEGSVRTAGDQVRISATLSQANTGYQVWSSSYDRHLKDVFAVQEEISRAIVDALRLKLAGNHDELLKPRMATGNTQAHDLLLKGRFAFNQKTAEGVRSAQQFFEQAIAIDPTYAPAYAALGNNEWYLAYRRFAPGDASYRAARTHALRALQLDSMQAEAYVVLGRVADVYERKYQQAQAYYAKAIALDPGNSDAYTLRAWLLMRLGHRDDAIAQVQHAVLVDPVSVNALNSLSAMYFYARRWDEAWQAVQQALALAPASPIVLGNAALTATKANHLDEALAYAEKAERVAPGEAFAVVTRAYVYGVRGDQAQAREQLAVLRRMPDVPAYLLATALIGVGDKEGAFQQLERAVASRDDFVGDLGVDPVFDPLHGDPRFNALLAKLGLPLGSH